MSTTIYQRLSNLLRVARDHVGNSPSHAPRALTRAVYDLSDVAVTGDVADEYSPGRLGDDDLIGLGAEVEQLQRTCRALRVQVAEQGGLRAARDRINGENGALRTRVKQLEWEIVQLRHDLKLGGTS